MDRVPYGLLTCMRDDVISMKCRTLIRGRFKHILFLKVKVKSLSCVRLFATPWTVAYQAPPSMGFSRQECWSGLPFPSPGDLPDPGIPGLPHCRQTLYRLSHQGITGVYCGMDLEKGIDVHTLLILRTE